jgi:small subunit ribosomal protein S20
MPIIKSAKKRVKQTEKRTLALRPFRTRMQTLYKNMKKWFDASDKEKMEAHFSEAVQAIDVAAKKNIIHKNNASRKKSTITKFYTALFGKDAKVAPCKTEEKKASVKTAEKAPAKKTPAKKDTPVKKTPVKKAPAKKTSEK